MGLSLKKHDEVMMG